MSLRQDEDERQAIETMKAMRAAQHSLWQIAKFLERNSVPTKRGAKWSATAVRAILMREQKIAA